MTICVNCGEEFIPGHYGPLQKYCNSRCRKDAYYIAHPEKLIEVGHRYYASHCKNVAIYHRKYYDDHRKAVNARNKNWFVTHPENNRIHNVVRRARKANAHGRFTTKEWLGLCDQTGNQCVCCGATGKLAADHIMPLVKGGSNYIENIQPLCKSCNSKKHTATIDYRPWADWT